MSDHNPMFQNMNNPGNPKNVLCKTEIGKKEKMNKEGWSDKRGINPSVDAFTGFIGNTTNSILLCAAIRTQERGWAFETNVNSCEEQQIALLKRWKSKLK